MRQIKYLFSNLIERKFEEQMKPEFEKKIQLDIFQSSMKDQFMKTLMNKQKKVDLFDPLQVLEYYRHSK